MGKEMLTFGSIEIEKNKFYRNSTPIFLKKYFGYLYNDNKVKPLHIMLPNTSAYVKIYDG